MHREWNIITNTDSLGKILTANKPPKGLDSLDVNVDVHHAWNN